MLDAQRVALRSFISMQQRFKEAEAPVGPERKKAEEAARQQADAGRRKADEERRNLDKVRSDTTGTADGMMQAVNQSWSEVTSALRAADLSHLISDPNSFKAEPVRDPAHAMSQCQTTAKEAQDAVGRALIELREHKDRRFFIVFATVIAALLIVVVVAVKLG